MKKAPAEADPCDRSAVGPHIGRYLTAKRRGDPNPQRRLPVRLTSFAQGIRLAAFAQPAGCRSKRRGVSRKETAGA